MYTIKFTDLEDNRQKYLEDVELSYSEFSDLTEKEKQYYSLFHEHKYLDRYFVEKHMCKNNKKLREGLRKWQMHNGLIKSKEFFNKVHISSDNKIYMDLGNNFHFSISSIFDLSFGYQIKH